MQESYTFKEDGRAVIVATDRNSLIDYINDRGGVRLFPTARNRIVYRAMAVTLNLRRVLSLFDPVRKLSLF